MINKKYVSVLAAALLSFGIMSTVLAAPDNFSVKADELEYDLQTGTGTAKGHVVLQQEDGTATADYAEFNSKAKTGVLVGNVIADKEDAHISCNKFIMHSENYLSAVGNAIVVKDGKSLFSDQVDYYKDREYAQTIGSWARLTDVDGSVLNAAKIDYDIKGGVANATGGVTIDSDARELTASADKAIYRTDSNGYIELIGNAKATQKGNSVAGDTLRLTNTNVATADGNVKIIYIPEKQPAKTEENVQLA